MRQVGIKEMIRGILRDSKSKGHLSAFQDEIFAFRSEMKKSTHNRGAKEKGKPGAYKYRIKTAQLKM